MYHSLIVDGKNTFDDFGLIPTSRPIINPPEPRCSYLEIPGRDGVIDLSESLTGMMSFSNRIGSIEFLVPKDKTWSELYSELLSFIQGRFRRIVLEDDPLYYYEGRLQIGSWKSNKNNSTIEIKYNLAPFKYETTNAVDGYLTSKRTFTNSGDYYYCDEYSKVLEMKVNCETSEDLNIKATINGIDYLCKPGENILPTLQTEGVNSIRVYGTGSATIMYRRGRL